MIKHMTKVKLHLLNVNLVFAFSSTCRYLSMKFFTVWMLILFYIFLFIYFFCTKYFCTDLFVRGMWISWESSWRVAPKRNKNCKYADAITWEIW